jgi:uncharacterized protein YecT (DUF1311 family)
MKYIVHAAVVISVLLGNVAQAEDTKLRDLEARLDSALTQADMNITSGDIAQYLDKKLIAKEHEIMKDLDEEGLRLFKEASKLWRDYRLSQVSFEGDLYRGGSIRPLIHNRVFARITRERYEALSKIMEP